MTLDENGLNVVYLYYYVMFIIIVGYLAGFRATLNHCEKAALLNLITFDPKVIEKPVTRLGLKTWMAVLEELEPLVFQA